MIAESFYWKKPLLRMATRLRRLKAGRHWNEKDYMRLERDVFFGFYSIRKLFEAPAKVTDKTKKRLVQIAWHANALPVHWRNNHRIEEHYDLDTTHAEQRPILYIANLVIHSFIFVPVLEEKGGLDSILFTSDREKDKRLYSLDVEELIRVLRWVGNDRVREIHWERGESDGSELLTVM